MTWSPKKLWAYAELLEERQRSERLEAAAGNRAAYHASEDDWKRMTGEK